MCKCEGKMFLKLGVVFSKLQPCPNKVIVTLWNLIKTHTPKNHSFKFEILKIIVFLVDWEREIVKFNFFGKTSKGKRARALQHESFEYFQ